MLGNHWDYWNVKSPTSTFTSVARIFILAALTLMVAVSGLIAYEVI